MRENPGEHIAVNKEFTPIPDELLESLESHGVEVKETITGFRLFDRLMLFPYVVNGPEGEYFLQVVPNYWAKKYWTAYPLWNPRALEYVSRKENFNVIFIYEKDILELGVDFVSKCIYEKINAPKRDSSLVSVENNEDTSTVEIFYDGLYMGELKYNKSETVISIPFEVVQ